MSCFWSHDWTRWEQYQREWTVTPLGILHPPEVRGKTIQCVDLYQKRICKRCGLMQDKPVGDHE